MNEDRFKPAPAPLSHDPEAGQEPLQPLTGEYVDDQSAYLSGAEAELVKQLTEGETGETNPEEEALARLSPRWEIRVQSERDPVAEETARYRQLAKEVDGRYGEEK